MREFPIQKFWYGKGAACKDMEELIEKNVNWFIWAVENFQDVTPKQAQHFKEVWKMDLPRQVITSQKLLDEINNGLPYEHKKKDTEDVYKELCRKYADATKQEWNEWLSEGCGEAKI